MVVLSKDGQTVDYFEKLFNTDYKKLGIWISGGADSAFCLWWLAKCIHDTGRDDLSIIPVHGRDHARVVDSSVAAQAVCKHVIDDFPNVNIKPLHVFEYYKDPRTSDKGIFHHAEKKRLKRDQKVDIIINSFTSNPPIYVMQQMNFFDNRQSNRDDPLEYFERKKKEGIHPSHKTFFDLHRPFALVDKSFIAHFYFQYNLMDLYLVTVSCIGDIGDKKYPCGKCFWCKEKKWAFGTYDGGVVD